MVCVECTLSRTIVSQFPILLIKLRGVRPMILQDAKIGKNYIISSIELDKTTMRRLEALGLTRGTMIKLLNRNHGGSVIVMVRGSRLALGGLISKAVNMKEATR